MRLIVISVSLALFVAAGGSTAAKPATKPASSASPWAEMHWRLLGPFRGGWAEMIDGIASRPDTFVIGAAGGGVWRTDNAGRTWTSLFDKGPTAPVGAVAIAPSNPDIIYAGTGQPTPRYDVAGGAGVFRSTDGGKTWSDLGLKDTRHIGRIWVDPKDPDHVLVAAVGHFFGPSPARGLYASRDGGKTWAQTLKIDDDTGVADIVADPGSPTTLFAASWQARQYPWQSYFTPIAGRGTALWRSDDGGSTWKKLGGAGWPEGPLGRVSVAATRTAEGLRLYAVVSAADKGGLYRSDDEGGRWTRVNDDQAFTGYYASHIAVAPDNPDVVYLVGQSIRRCAEGGAKCEIIHGAPGGDDYHFVWLNPKDPSRWAYASDQGAAITVDGGKTFSSWFNQPTAQFYHLATDNQFPYRIYSGQQDSGTAALLSRSDYGAPNFRDWKPAGADERDYVIPDPEDPNIIYGTGLGGRLSRYDNRTGEVANIAPFLEPNYGKRQISVAHHFVWVTPFAISRTGPVTLYEGAEVVFKSTDRGQTWTVASPDLGGKLAGGKAPSAKDCDGDVAVSVARACGYGGIWSITTSTRHAGEVWVGTDSGLVHMTRDDGSHWSDVTPPGVPSWAKIASVEVSALEDGVAYVVIDNQRQDDFAPHIMATRDYGKTWRDISSGLPVGQFASVVRADPVKAGLIFAGTETGVFVSQDDGAHWSGLQQNLPTAWVRDLAIHGGDLIAATQGRAIWILDDIAPLRESGLDLKAPRLLKPAVAVRVRPNNNRDTPLPPEEPAGENPPSGAVIDYSLPAGAKSVALEVRDASGAMVQRIDDQPPGKVEADRYFASTWVKPGQPPSRTAGMHRALWNLRWTRPRTIAYEYAIAAVAGQDTPIAPGGAWALPGAYAVGLIVDGKAVGSQPLTVAPDPRTSPDRGGMEASLTLSKAIGAALGDGRDTLAQAQSVKADLAKRAADKPAVADAVRAAMLWTKPTEEVTGLSAQLAGVETDLESADRGPTEVQTHTVKRIVDAMLAASGTWSAHLRDDLPALNAKLIAAGTKPIIPPNGAKAELRIGGGGGGGEDLP